MSGITSETKPKLIAVSKQLHARMVRLSKLTGKKLKFIPDQFLAPVIEEQIALHTKPNGRAVKHRDNRL